MVVFQFFTQYDSYILILLIVAVPYNLINIFSPE